MNRFSSPTDIVTLNSRSGVVFAAIPVTRRRTAPSDRLLVKLARLFRPLVVTMSVERRPVRIEDDEETRAALLRDGFPIDQGRFRGGPPRNLDARYDLLRHLR